MGSLSDYSENELLDHALGTAYSPVATVYLALATADPTDAGTGASFNEVANANGYARVPITFGAAASRRVTQSGDVDFGPATGSWGTVTHYAILDSGTHGAGNMLAHGALNTSKSVVNGNSPTVPSADVYVEIDAGEMSDYLANKLLDLMFRNTAYSAPSTYVGLTTATVADSDTGSTITEVSGGSYARVQVNANGGGSPAWTAASGGAADNGAAVAFPTATGSWGTVTSVVICDAATLGNLLWYDNTMADQAVASTDDVSFATGALDVSLA